MTVKDLLGLDKYQQEKRIKYNPFLRFDEALKNPQILDGKEMCFIENFDRICTEGLVVRKVSFDTKKQKWYVSDIDLSDNYESKYDTGFSTWEMQYRYPELIHLCGYLLDKEN